MGRNSEIHMHSGNGAVKGAELPRIMRVCGTRICRIAGKIKFVFGGLAPNRVQKILAEIKFGGVPRRVLRHHKHRSSRFEVLTVAEKDQAVAKAPLHAAPRGQD